jgi:ubiquinone/menaquinone biosynthesis C-methylase UbiE
MKSNSPFDLSKDAYQQARIKHWDVVANKRDHWRGAGSWYHRRLNQIYQFLITPGQRVLEIGCGIGDLLAELQPARGVGVDFSPEMITRARAKHPALEFVQADAHNLAGIKGPFDVVIFSDAVNDLWDVQTAHPARA